MSTTIERAIAYLRAMPPAMSGSGGHATTYAAALALTRGFALDEETALRVLCEVHNPQCSPPWSPRELRHKVRSAAASTKVEHGYLLRENERRNAVAPSRPDEQPRPDPTSYHNVATKLIELCPFTEEPDVLAYMDQRVLILMGAKAQLAGLPRYDAQRELVAKLLETFDERTLELAGLLGRNEHGELLTERLWCAGHRLVIPWRTIDGTIDVLQRRRIDAREPKYVFPRGRKPMNPFGVEALRVTDADAPLVYCEGAIDVLALRLMSRRDDLGLIPLGLPGAKHWRAEWARWAKGRDVFVGFDADATGDEAVQRITSDLFAAGARNVSRMRPRAADWAAQLEAAE
jgi:hypothetical protein